MSLFLTLSFLFFIGSIFGWVLELLYRNLTHAHTHWINPGFCTGPYVPLYGFGLCTLFLLATVEDRHLIANPVWNKVITILVMAVAMTLIEYLAGILCLKVFKVRLWDYSMLWGNVQGLICPIFSLIWGLVGAAYDLFIHPHILNSLHWLSGNLAFSFVIGLFFGVFLIDVAHSAQLVTKMKQFAEEYEVVLIYEQIKQHIQEKRKERALKYHFFRPFQTDLSLHDHLREMYEKTELRHRQQREQLRKFKQKKQNRRKNRNRSHRK